MTLSLVSAWETLILFNFEPLGGDTSSKRILWTRSTSKYDREPLTLRWTPTASRSFLKHKYCTYNPSRIREVNELKDSFYAYQPVLYFQRIYVAANSWSMLFPELLYYHNGNSSVRYHFFRRLRLWWHRWWCQLSRKWWHRHHNLSKSLHHGLKLIGSSGPMVIGWGHWGYSFLFFVLLPRGVIYLS